MVQFNPQFSQPGISRMQQARSSSQEALQHRKPRRKLIPSIGVFYCGALSMTPPKISRWSKKRLERWANRLIERRERKAAPRPSSFNLLAHMRKRQLKRGMTRHECLIQDLLRSMDIAFSAQHGFINESTIYIVDFFLPDPLNLIIEVDGGSHDSAKQRKRDAVRDGFFLENELRVIRITNHEASTMTSNALRRLILVNQIGSEDPADQFKRFL